VAELLFVDAGTFLLSAFALLSIRKSFNTADPPAASDTLPSSRLRRTLADVRDGLRYVVGHPVLRNISLMMALINFFGSAPAAQMVFFAKERLDATDTEVGVLFAFGSAGVVLVGLTAGRIRAHLSFAVTALGALVVSGLTMAALGMTTSFWLALPLAAATNGFGLLLNINTGALRQAITPPHLFGRVISIAGVLAWSAIPLGALLGAWAIEATDDVALVFVASGLLTAGIALAFSFSPVREGDHYLEEAKARQEQEVIAA
jgi:hypothetical protein